MACQNAHTHQDQHTHGHPACDGSDHRNSTSSPRSCGTSSCATGSSLEHASACGAESDGCCAIPTTAPTPRYRRALWIALIVNAAMFGVEIIGGLQAHSVSLLADAIDFAGDAFNYGIALLVLGLAPVWRSRAALLKGVSMGAFGLFVLGRALWSATQGIAVEPLTMGTIALLALAANVGVALLLYAFRDGDANMRSVWLCSRNDAIGNVAVALAAVGVFGTGSAWPDLLVALVMGALGLSAAVSIIRQAREELSHSPASA